MTNEPVKRVYEFKPMLKWNNGIPVEIKLGQIGNNIVTAKSDPLSALVH